MTTPSEPTPTPPSDSAAEKLILASPDSASAPKDFALWAGVILLAVLVVFSPAMRGQFIWDDDRHVEQNRNLRDLPGLVDIWTKLGMKNGGTPQYYPLTHTTYWIEARFARSADGRIEPTIFHVTNAILHAAAAIALWFVLRRLTVPGAWIIAAVWAIHPMQAESVAWISERKNVLCGALFFSSLLAYLAAFPERFSDEELSPRQRPFPWNLYAAALLLFAGAMLSKTVACSLPAVILVLTWWKRGRLKLDDLLSLIPFFAIGLALAAVTVYVERTQIGASGPEWHLTFAGHILVAARAIAFYFDTTFWPVHLSFIYPRWEINPASFVQWIFPLVVVAAISLLFTARRQIGRGPFAAALIYCGVLVPALGFFNVYPMRYSFVADHFQYLAQPALIALVVGFVATILSPLFAERDDDDNPALAPYVLSAVALLTLAILTFMRAQVFIGMIPLWRDVISKNPASWMAHYNLGTALWQEAIIPGEHDAESQKKMLGQSFQHFGQALALSHPEPDKVNNNWGAALLDDGQVGPAIDRFRQAIAANPANAAALANLGQALQQQNKLDEALATLRRAADVAQRDERLGNVARAAIHERIAEILLAQKQQEGALAEYAEAVRLNRSALKTRYVYASLLAQNHRLKDAAAQFAAILALDPRYVDARISLAMLQMEVGNLRDANGNLRVAAELDPRHPRIREAVELWQKLYRASTQPSATTQSATRPATTRAAP